MSKYSMEQKPSEDERKRRKTILLKSISKNSLNNLYLKTKEEGTHVKTDKILFISGLRGATGYSRQEVNLAITELIREKIITIEKENKVEFISYYTPQEVIDGTINKSVGLSEAELDDILHEKPIRSFPDITICKSCNCLTHDKKGQESICAKCGKNRNGEIAK